MAESKYIYRMPAKTLIDADGIPSIVMRGMAGTVYLAPLAEADVTAQPLDIAALPDLLAALERAVASGKSWQGITSARAAIAKAKGE